MDTVGWRKTFLLYILPLALLSAPLTPVNSWALASNNVPLDSPVYYYLEKLASFGLITSDFKGIRPISKAEAARLLAEAEQNMGGGAASLAGEMIEALRRGLEREIALRDSPQDAPLFAAKPLAAFKARYVYLDGAPRSYERPVHDPGGDGVFGIGAGLRPDNLYPSPVQQHGTEGTPLLENNEGVVYGNGSSLDLRFSSEAYAGRHVSALLEPLFLYGERDGLTRFRLNKGYAKLGGGGLELELGRDANWLGLGERGNITLTNNAANFDLAKLSSPEPIAAGFLGALKYTLIFSRFDRTDSAGKARRPFFLAAKVSLKPAPPLELGLNLGRQVGGTGVDNGFGSTLRGLVGGTNNDNSNSMAGLELRWRLPFLRNTEVYGEFSGEDSASFWPIVESYVAGIYIPRLSADGRNDFRFEYFLGNQILYTNGTFPSGYVYRGMPVGHSQGGAAQDFFFRYRHWFSARHYAALEYIHGERGNLGRVPVNGSGAFDPNGELQAVERKNSWRAFWNFPVLELVDGGIMYGWERVDNLNLAGGVSQTNQVVQVDLSYRY
ncbi:MAG: capsule assembly Wzi family protein [Geobacteraceae bacterium]|nr:capsule assembly Wzi family protein [Geobacteraceae bacterium]